MTHPELIPLVKARRDAWRDCQHYATLLLCGCDVKQEHEAAEARHELLLESLRDAKCNGA